MDTVAHLWHSKGITDKVLWNKWTDMYIFHEIVDFKMN